MHGNSYRQQYRKEIALSRIQPPGAFNYILVLDNLKPGFNVGKIFRTGNALGCHEVHLVNIGMFNPNPGKGTVKQTRTRSFELFEQNYQWLKENGYSIFVLDPRGKDVLGSVAFPEKSAFVFGHEENGFSFDPAQYPDIQTIQVKQFGVVESMNVSIVAAMASFEYLRQREFSAQ
jgi:tRNA G18 (ribose-2'-O)-methylase SpoU